MVIAWFAILFTGRYPRGLFDYVVGVGHSGTPRAGIRLPPAHRLLSTLQPPLNCAPGARCRRRHTVGPCESPTSVTPACSSRSRTPASCSTPAAGRPAAQEQRDLDAVLVTHQHPDHLDQERLPDLLRANPGAQLVDRPRHREAAAGQGHRRARAAAGGHGHGRGGDGAGRGGAARPHPRGDPADPQHRHADQRRRRADLLPPGRRPRRRARGGRRAGLPPQRPVGAQPRDDRPSCAGWRPRTRSRCTTGCSARRAAPSTSPRRATSGRRRRGSTTWPGDEPQEFDAAAEASARRARRPPASRIWFLGKPHLLSCVPKNSKAAKGTKVAKAKKKCCKDKPRCAQCPVVLMRLEKMGYAERDDEKPRRYTVDKTSQRRQCSSRGSGERLASSTMSDPRPRPSPCRAAPVPPAAPQVALRLRGLTKRFGATTAVDHLDLDVPRGSFYGLVGPNGAGKTTTLSMATGLLRPDAGTAHVLGVDVWADPVAAKAPDRHPARRPAAVRPAHRPAAGDVCRPAARDGPASSVAERTGELLAALGLTDAADKLVIDYSAGMTKKITLACALVHAPRLLVLDEPFEAVDPVSARTIRGILEDFAANGGTVVLSSHVMDLVERICTDVAIIAAGRGAGRRHRSTTCGRARAWRTASSTWSAAAPTWRAWRGCAPRPTEARTCCATACGAASPPSWGWCSGVLYGGGFVVARPRRAGHPARRRATSSSPGPWSWSAGAALVAGWALLPIILFGDRPHPRPHPVRDLRRAASGPWPSGWCSPRWSGCPGVATVLLVLGQRGGRRRAPSPATLAALVGGPAGAAHLRPAQPDRHRRRPPRCSPPGAGATSRGSGDCCCSSWPGPLIGGAHRRWPQPRHAGPAWPRCSPGRPLGWAWAPAGDLALGEWGPGLARLAPGRGLWPRSCSWPGSGCWSRCCATRASASADGGKVAAGWGCSGGCPARRWARSPRGPAPTGSATPASTSRRS